MIQAIVFVLVFCMSAFAVQAQKAADFSGKWNLDKAQSKMDERMTASIESMTMTVTQSATDLTVANATKRVAPPAGAPAGGPGGGGGRGMGGGGDTTTKYTLDGKETAVETEGQMGKSVAKYKAVVEGSKATLSTSRTTATQQGEMTSTTKDVWTLSADGKMLTVNREQVSPRGTTSSTMVFTKG